jgi:hypothetical protein
VVVLQTCEPEASRLRSTFMRGAIVLVGLITITVASCNRAQSVMQSAVPPENASELPVTADDPATTGSIVPTPDQTVACTQQVAGQIVQVQHTLQASNEPCVVYWRSLEVQRHPERAPYLECNGLKAYPDPQPAGHPISLAECDRKLRERQARMGVPVTGMSEEDKAKYRATWGGG